MPALRMQLSGSAQDAGAHVLRAWRILHVAERQGRERVCKGGTLTSCDRPDVASRHGRTVVAAQRTHASIRMQLSGSAQDAGPHALWAWRILHVAERKGANVCAKAALSRTAIGQMS